MVPNRATHHIWEHWYNMRQQDAGILTSVADYFNSPQILTPPVIINQRKMTPSSHNKLENSETPQVIMTPLISTANQ